MLIENAANLGFAAGNNVGIRHLLEDEFDLNLLLDNDAVAESQCLCELMRAAETHPAAAYGATVYELAEPGRVWYAGGTIDRLTLEARHETAPPEVDDAAHSTDFITGCGVMFRSEVLHSVGLLDPAFFAYYEDLDWCLRACAFGAQLDFVPQARVRHEVSRTFLRIGGPAGNLPAFRWAQSRPLVLYLAYRNRLLIVRKHARGRLHLGLLVLRRLARAGLHAGLLSLVGKGRQAAAVARGTWDGLRLSGAPARVEPYFSMISGAKRAA